MSEQYLPIEESLGYKNVKEALWKIFKINLDCISIHKGMYENFNFPFYYKKYNMIIEIVSTGKDIQFEYGEGGIFDVLFPNPKYPEDSIFNEVSLYELVKNKEHSESIFGKDEKSVEHALQVLKDFLDSDDAKVLLRK